MTRRAHFSRALTLAGLLFAGAVGLVGLSVAGAGPASAQFFGWGGGGGGWGGNSWGNPPRPQRSVPQPSNNPFRQLFSPYGNQSQSRPAPQADYSKAPPPRKQDATPTTTIAVLGDSMADWLAYGLEDTFADTPEVGIIRKNRTYSGLIRYDTRADTDWARTAREILAADKPSYIVMMIGLADRQSLRERIVPHAAAQPAEHKDQPGKDQAQGKPAQGDQAQAKPQPSQASPNGEPQEGPADQPDQPAPAHEATGPGRTATYEFRSEKWEEAYGRLIDNTIAALKSKGAPVFWVGLPAVRGTKSMADVSYLNSLYRGHAEKAGIVYVDVWDGFVDEGGRFAVQGPDFEGQTRRLRTADGVHFTKAGALKLAHYVEREIRRAMQNHTAPIALAPPEEATPAAPAAPAKPGEPPARPAAGPVVPLTTFSGNSEELVGGAPTRSGPNSDPPPVARVMVKGDPVPGGPRGRADDFSWPRTTATAETEVIDLAPPSRLPAGSAAPVAPASSSPRASQGGAQSGQAALGSPKAEPKPGAHRPRAPKKPEEAQAGRGFFGLGFGAQRPPGAVGQSAPQRSGGIFGNW